MKINLIPILALICGISSCQRPEDIEKQKSLEGAYFSLLSIEPTDDSLDRVEVNTGNHTQTFIKGGSSQSGLDELKKNLRNFRISGSDPLVRASGSNNESYAKFTLFSGKSERSYDLLRSKADPKLFCMKVPLVGDSVGSSLIYFYFRDGNNPFAPLLNRPTVSSS